MMNSLFNLRRPRAHRGGRVRRALWAASLAASFAAGSGCKPEPPRPPTPPEPDRIVAFEGSVQLGNGDALAYRAILAPDPAAPGHHLGTIDIPMQALAAASLERVVFQPGRRVTFALALPGTPRWAGEVGAGGAIACEFRQRDIRLPCSMRQVAATGEAWPPPAGDGPRATAER